MAADVYMYTDAHVPVHTSTVYEQVSNGLYTVQVAIAGRLQPSSTALGLCGAVTDQYY
jgi:hypothetical protein